MNKKKRMWGQVDYYFFLCKYLFIGSIDIVIFWQKCTSIASKSSCVWIRSSGIDFSFNFRRREHNVCRPSSSNWVKCWYCCSMSLLLLFTSSNWLVWQGFRSKDRAPMRQKGFLFLAHHLNRITIDFFLEERW